MLAAYEKLCADTAAEETLSLLHQPSQDPHADAFSAAVRQPWRRSNEKPTVRSNLRNQSFLNRYAANGHTGAARRAVARIESHEKANRLLSDRLQHSHDGGDPGKFIGSWSAVAPFNSQPDPNPSQQKSFDNIALGPRSRDPRR